MQCDDRRRIAQYLEDRRKYGGAIWRYDPELLRKVREQVHEEYPIHSLHRGALIHERYHQELGAGKQSDSFGEALSKIGMTKEAYLKEAKESARIHQYNPDVLSFANNGKNKLKYDSPEGAKYFGRIGYRDYIMWKHLEKQGKVRRGLAEQKRRTYKKSHGKISEIYQLGKHSPNELSLKILW